MSLPSEQELQLYLKEKNVEQILTSILEAVCYNRPEDVPNFIAEFLVKFFNVKTANQTPQQQQQQPAQQSATWSFNSSAFSNEKPAATSIAFKPQAVLPARSKAPAPAPAPAPQNNSGFEPFNFGNSSSSPTNEEEEDIDEDLADEKENESNAVQEIDPQISENIRRRYSVSFDRRGALSSESIPDDDVNSFTRVVVKKSEDERGRLEASLARISLFKHLDEEELQIMYDAMFEKKFKAGEKIITQGDIGDYFYVVDTGECEITKQTPGEESKVIKNVKAGDYFGELALIFGTPRAANVIAKTDVRLWAIDRITYRKILMKQTQKKRKLYEGFLKQCSILQTLTDYERDTIADALVPETYKDGDIIVRQGEPGHSFYIIVEGEVVCLKEETNRVSELVRLKAPEYFGELALLFDQPRACTVQAIGTVKTVKLDRRSFKQLLGPAEDVLKRNMEHYNKYIATKL